MIRQFHARTLFVLGGLAASLLLVAFGIVSIVVGYQGRDDVRDMLRQEQIIGPKASRIPGQLVDTGSEARAQADIIRIDQLASANGLTYAQMGRFATPDGNPAGTSDAALALKDNAGKPVANPVRSQWVTATALSTALNTAYFAEQVALFTIVMGFALTLTGVGFVVLTLGVLWKHNTETADAAARAAIPAAPLRTG